MSHPFNLETMPSLTKYAFFTFIGAKLFGTAGVVLGLIPGPFRILGGCLLATGFILIFTSVTLSLIQMKKNKGLYDEEDDEKKVIKALKTEKLKLKKELEDLKERRDLSLALSEKRHGW